MSKKKMAIKDSWSTGNGRYKCPHCGKCFLKNGILLHIWRKHTKAGKMHSRKPKRRRKYSRIHTGWYKGYWCDSGWELAFILYHLDKGHSVERNTKGYPYVYRGKLHRFYPDFIVNGEFYEVKGIMTAQNKAKIAQFPKDITVIGKAQMKPIFAAVYKKYGNDFAKELFKKTKAESLK